VDDDEGEATPLPQEFEGLPSFVKHVFDCVKPLGANARAQFKRLANTGGVAHVIKPIPERLSWWIL
jgi:hypothetical protein